MHPVLEREVYAQTAVCYMRFLRKVKIDYLEIPIIHFQTDPADRCGRAVPFVPTHPAHIMVSLLDQKTNCWNLVKEVELPPNPKFSGVGLSLEMSTQTMDEFFTKAVAEQPLHRINLGGLVADCVKVECDREHPVWPNHCECNGGIFNVPFAMFRRIGAFGEEMGELVAPVWHRKLEKTVFEPVAPDGMTINARNPLEIRFQGKKLAVGFSLIRPMLTHLAWDSFGEGKTSLNRLLFNGRDGGGFTSGFNAPSYITTHGNFCGQNMSGKVSVQGNQVRYEVETGCGIILNARFTVTAESITLELEQKTERDLPVLEGEAWRLLWNMKAGMTSVASPPLEKEGRNGFVKMQGIIVGDGAGCLAVKLMDGKGAFHTESYRRRSIRSTGFVLGELDTTEAATVIPKGISRAFFEFSPCNLAPVPQEREGELPESLKKCWADGFTAFRPEHGGFSNNAISTNCHVNQWVTFDFAVFTVKASHGMDPMELVKFSIGRALMDGGGYGYHRNRYLDSDPILLSGAGRILQLSDDKKWLQHISPGVSVTAKRILDNFDAKEGMIVCRALSGNSGTYRWSTNAMDCTGFGHIDAYVNAWSFRAMKNASVMLKVLGDISLAERCREVADALSENYARQLLNPETGWVSGWRSRDGRLHDYGFIWVNAVACAFGVMGEKETTHALKKLEEKRQAVFPESGYLGLPLNLIPFKETDHQLVRMEPDIFQLVPTYEYYTDGTLCPCWVGHYIRALSTYGLKKEANKIATSIEQGFADGKFRGPYGSGNEFATWAGVESGYEGTFGTSSAPLYAIAVERGIITPTVPEWWVEV